MQTASRDVRRWHTYDNGCGHHGVMTAVSTLGQKTYASLLRVYLGSFGSRSREVVVRDRTQT